MSLSKRENILEAIRRTAKENRGVPLGVQRFESETGIKPHDWMKYWARFGDALREAGFNPNEWQGAFDDNQLIKTLIELTRDLNRFPTKGDLSVKHHSDKSFPSVHPFRRLGTKNEVILKIITYCQSHDGYADILSLVEPLVAKHQEQTLRADSEVNEGYVYLIKSGRYYKIGKTNSAGRREYELAIQLPEKPNTIHVIKTDDPTGIEAYWHKRFESKRKGGEWFDLDADDVRIFKRRKFM